MGMFDWDLRTGTFWCGAMNAIACSATARSVKSNPANLPGWRASISGGPGRRLRQQEANAKLEHKEFISEYRIMRHNNSGIRWVLAARGHFLYDGDKPVRMIGLKQDITEARQRAETQRVLVGELQHRTRNLMAVVQSIAHQDLAYCGVAQGFRGPNSIGALQRCRADKASCPVRTTHPSLLAGWSYMELEALSSHAIGDKIAFGGPEAPLRKSSVEMLTLAIHELLTNAIKYGALASDAWPACR